MVNTVDKPRTLQKTAMDDMLPVPQIPVVHGRWNLVVEACRSKKVLHLGCVDSGLTQARLESGGLMHGRLAEAAAELWGVDLDQDGLDIMREAGFDNLLQADLESAVWTREHANQQFDVIVAPELFEHLNNPGLVLQCLKELFTPNTTMIITVPNGWRITGRRDLLKGYERVNPDHNYWFSYSTLSTLLRKNGYETVDAAAYSYVDHRASALTTMAKGAFSLIGWKKGKSRIKRAGEILIRRWYYSRNPSFADGLIFTVRPAESR